MRSENLEARVLAALGSVVLAVGAAGCRRSTNGSVDPYVQVVAGSDNTCARTASGRVYCWGDDAFNSTSLSAADVPPGRRRWPMMVGRVQDAIDLDVGSSYGCAIDRSGGVACFRDATVDDPRSGRAGLFDCGPNKSSSPARSSTGRAKTRASR